MQTSTRNPAKPHEPDDSRTLPASGVAAPVSPRAAALLHLVDDLRAALVGGDPEAALVLHETIGVLLRPAAPVAPSAEVVDLYAERKRRAGG